MSNIESKTAFVFPGQGSQSLGMLSELASNFKLVKECFEEASDALSYDLWELSQHNKDKLAQTEVTQPALLTASIACLRVLKAETEHTAQYLAGHSLGEYTALVAADVLSLSAGVKLVQARGQFMQNAVAPGEGAMYAIIGLDDQAIVSCCEDICEQTKEVVSAVNFNSPGQVVIAGVKNAADKAAAELKALGAKRALPLAVSVPSHCALMKGASEKLAVLLSAVKFADPSLPIVNNVDVAIAADADSIKNALVRQLYMPVRWTESVQFLAENGVSNILEVGPGKVLSGLVKRIDKSLSVRVFNSPSDI